MAVLGSGDRHARQFGPLARTDLIVSTFPPTRCGVAAYAFQSFLSREQRGRQVRRIALKEGEGDANLLINDTRSIVRLFAFVLVRRFDETDVQYVDAFFQVTEHGVRRRLNSALLIVLLALIRLRSRRMTTIVHEFIDTDEIHLLHYRRAIFLIAGTILFHTEPERQRFLDFHDGRFAGKAVVADHGRDLLLFADEGRHAARRRLDLDEGACVFLCIGFFTPLKGVDEAVTVFREAALDDAVLHVIGSCRTGSAREIAVRDELRDLSAAADNIVFEDRYVSDDEFDRWIVAADAVVIPYTRMWSSGVAARAKLAGTRVIGRALPSLERQLHGHALTTFRSTDDLAGAFRRVHARTMQARSLLAPVTPGRQSGRDG